MPIKDADDEAWNKVGRDLRRLDPGRYQEILRVAREIVGIHRDPLGATGTVPPWMRAPDTEDFD